MSTQYPGGHQPSASEWGRPSQPGAPQYGSPPPSGSPQSANPFAAPGPAAASGPVPYPAQGVGFAEPARPRAGSALAVLGLAVTITAIFGLALEHFGKRYGQDVYAGMFSSAGRQPRNELYGTGLAMFWWGYGVFIAIGLIAVAIAWAALTASRVAGVVILVITAASAAVHAVALTGTADYIKAAQAFKRAGSVFDHPGIGVWVSFAGFLLLMIGAVLVIVQGGAKRRA